MTAKTSESPRHGELSAPAVEKMQRLQGIISHSTLDAASVVKVIVKSHLLLPCGLLLPPTMLLCMQERI